MPPLPGSPAICAGRVTDIPTGVTTDQRGLPRTSTYGTNPPCVDSGPVQTNYSVSFSTEPPSSIPADNNFTVAVQVKESGDPFPVSGIGILIALATGNSGALNISSLTTNSAGIAAASQLQVSAPGTDNTLMATLPLTASGITPAATRSSTSTAFDVTQSNGVQVTLGASLSGAGIYRRWHFLHRAGNAHLAYRLATHTVADFSPIHFGNAIHLCIVERWRSHQSHRDSVHGHD